MIIIIHRHEEGFSVKKTNLPHKFWAWHWNVLLLFLVFGSLMQFCTAHCSQKSHWSVQVCKFANGTYEHLQPFQYPLFLTLSINSLIFFLLWHVGTHSTDCGKRADYTAAELGGTPSIIATIFCFVFSAQGAVLLPFWWRGGCCAKDDHESHHVLTIRRQLYAAMTCRCHKSNRSENFELLPITNSALRKEIVTYLANGIQRLKNVGLIWLTTTLLISIQVFFVLPSINSTFACYKPCMSRWNPNMLKLLQPMQKFVC